MAEVATQLRPAQDNQITGCFGNLPACNCRAVFFRLFLLNHAPQITKLADMGKLAGQM